MGLRNTPSSLFALLAFLIQAPAAPAFAVSQTFYPASTQSDGWGGFAACARVAAMGSAPAALADDGPALLGDPAGLASVAQDQFLEDSQFWLVDTFQETLLFALPVGPGAGAALAVGYLNDGSFQGRDALGSLTEDYSAEGWALRAGAGLGIGGGGALGISAQVRQTDLAGVPDREGSLDLGGTWDIPGGLRIGAVYGHLGLYSSSGDLAGVLQYGVGRSFSLDRDTRLWTVLGGAWEPDGPGYWRAGVECGFGDVFFLRAGLQQPWEDQGWDGSSGWTAGVGVVFSDLEFDYAYLPYGALGASHQLSLGYRFAAPKPDVTAPPPASPAAAVPKPGNPAPGALVVQFDVPGDPETARALEARGKYDEAAQIYIQDIQKQPGDKGLWRALGGLYMKAGRADFAGVCFRRIIQIDPTDAEASDWLKAHGVPAPTPVPGKAP